MKLYKNLSSALKESSLVEYLKIKVDDSQIPPDLFLFPNLKDLFIEAPHLEALIITQNTWPVLTHLTIKAPKLQSPLGSLFLLPKLENLKIIATPLSNLSLPLGQILSPLTSLTIKDCGLEKLPEEFDEFDELVELSLPENKLKSLPHSFIELTELKRLNLDSNHFEKFPDVLKNLPRLRHLSIDQNKFDDEEKARIQREFYLTPR